ncbi:MAG TPA: pitrilysin family protein [Acidimicrobiales bacterium]|nr:pitrilysin family protein [Acidimicrobiales bacterium]
MATGVAIAARGGTPAGAARNRVTHRSTTLDGGLTVVTETMADVRSASIGFWVGTGSVDEPDAHAGASHFLEHLLFKGTAERSARSIALAIDSVGGDMNAYTTKEYTTFYVRVLSEDVDMGVDLLSDIVWSPAFRPEEFESERQVILEEILMHADDPADLVHDVLAGAMWPNHPLGREVLGTADTVTSVDRDEVARFHAHHYRPGNVVVAAAGAVDHDRICELVSSRLPSGGPGERPSRTAPSAAAAAQVALGRDTEQTHLCVAVPGPDRDDEDRHALSIVEHVLGGGMSSRLFQSIREERGLAYSVYSYRLGFQGTGALAVYAGTSPAQAASVQSLIEEELDRMATDGITPEELDAARGHVRGAMALGLEDSGARMGRIGHAQLVHGRVLTLDQIEHRLTSLQLDDINRVAARWLAAPRTVVSVGPEEAA